MNIRFKVTGIDCANCATEFERKIQKVKGVINASISFMTERLEVEIEEEKSEEILKQIEKIARREDANLEQI